MSLTAIFTALSLPLATLTEGLPSNLVGHNLPKLDESIQGKMQDYSEARGAVFCDWHPTELKMLIRTRFGNTMQLHELSNPMGARVQLTFSDEPIADAIYEPTCGSYIVYSQDKGGDEYHQLYRLDPDKTRTLLTDGSSKHHSATFTNDGILYYIQVARGASNEELWLMDPHQPEQRAKVKTLEKTGWGIADISQDLRFILLGKYISATESQLWLLDRDGDVLTQLDLSKNPTYYGDARFLKDPIMHNDGLSGELIVTTTEGSDFARLARVDLRFHDFAFLTGFNRDWDVEAIDLTSEKDFVFFTRNENGFSTLYSSRIADWDTGPELSWSTKQGVISTLRSHPSFGSLAITLGNSESLSDIIINGSPWTKSETGNMPANLPKPSLMTWTASDGVELSAFAYEPDPAKFPGKRPVIVNIHGGPESQAKPGFLGRINYYLCELGVAVIFPNVRGSSGYGSAFLEADNGLKRDGSYTDVDSLLDHLAEQANLDAERIMITGGSYGGHMTLVAAYRLADRVRCFLSVVGMSHLVTFLENTAPYRQDLRRVEYGDERDPEMRAWMEKWAPINNLDQMTKPLFLVQGANDPRVPVSEAQQIFDALTERGVPAWMLIANDEGHGFAKKENIDIQFAYTIAFIKQFLLD